MTTEKATVSERLREAMKEADGMSQRELARRLAGKGASAQRRENVRRQVAKWLNGTRPEKENAQKLASIFGKPPDYFVTTRQAQRDELAQVRADVDALRLVMQRRVQRVEKLLRELQEQFQAALGER